MKTDTLSIDEVLKLKNFKKDALSKLFKLSNQERYEHVGQKVRSAQGGKDYKMAKRDYDWLMISRHIHENMKSQFKGGMYKEMLWNAAKATSVGRAKYDLLLNNICEVFNRQLVDCRDQPIITCLEYIIEYLMKRIVVVQKVIAKTVGPLTPFVTKLFDAIKKKATKCIVQWNGGMTSQSGVVNVGMWVITGKATGVKVVQLKLVVLVQGMSLVKLVQDEQLVQGVSLVKLLVQGMSQVNLVVLVNPLQHKAQQPVQEMPQVKLMVLVA
uniref:Uncharacterized protein n=1 Tax=Tanacetum cinerariifolium TaxID=118510 RepID=A0A6L2LI21_TANCI|nr:hypothetical protein [Tanacetum cinerariifolium]